jgi:hypothetical protein
MTLPLEVAQPWHWTGPAAQAGKRRACYAPPFRLSSDQIIERYAEVLEHYADGLAESDAPVVSRSAPAVKLR